LAFLNFKVVIREFKRGYTPLKNFYPLPLIKGKGKIFWKRGGAPLKLSLYLFLLASL